MTELEILEHAKMYMEKLANGINPLDDSAIPDGDVVNNVRISRCLFYVADVLGKVIDEGGTAAQKKARKDSPKEPFSLSVEQRAAFLFSETPIPISRISERINMLRSGENVATLGFAAIRDWLVSAGMLERVTDNDGKAAVRPTAQGESIGIATEVRTGSRGTFVVVVYNLDAQNFIMDNLDAIIEFERIRKEKRGPNWRAEHDRILWELHRQGVPVSNIAEALGRDPDAVGERLKKLGITK